MKFHVSFFFLNNFQKENLHQKKVISEKLNLFILLVTNKSQFLGVEKIPPWIMNLCKKIIKFVYLRYNSILHYYYLLYL